MTHEPNDAPNKHLIWDRDLKKYLDLSPENLKKYQVPWSQYWRNEILPRFNNEGSTRTSEPLRDMEPLTDFRSTDTRRSLVQSVHNGVSSLLATLFGP